MSDLYFKNGKPKKKYMYCLNRGLREMRMLYGRDIIQCGGCNCSYYAVGCGRMKLRDWEKEHTKTKKGLTNERNTISRQRQK